MKSLIIVLALLLFIATPVYSEIRYNIIDLGTLSTWPSSSYAYSINDSGQIVGFAYNEYNLQRACLFNVSGPNVELGSVSGQAQSCAYSINDAGQIVGGYGFDNAILYDSSGDGANIKLRGIEAWCINNDGQIVGADNNYKACIFDPSGSGNNINLGTLGGWNISIAYANNDSGQIVGVSHTSDNQAHACLFDSSGQGINRDLGLLPTGNTSYAYAINNNGLAVGYASVGNSFAQWRHACLFDLNNGNTDLGTLVGGDESEAWSISDNGIIVGRSYTEEKQWRACLFDPTGQGNNIDLNYAIPPDSGWFLETARGVNNDGWIVGWGASPDGCTHGYLLTPIPEPASLLLLGLGGLLIRKR